jgi:hypothetical protein
MLLHGISPQSNYPMGAVSATPLSLSLYVSNFDYFSEDPAVEQLFYCLLGKPWFLGVHFS